MNNFDCFPLNKKYLISRESLFNIFSFQISGVAKNMGGGIRAFCHGCFRGLAQKKKTRYRVPEKYVKGLVHPNYNPFFCSDGFEIFICASNPRQQT